MVQVSETMHAKLKKQKETTTPLKKALHEDVSEGRNFDFNWIIQQPER